MISIRLKGLVAFAAAVGFIAGCSASTDISTQAVSQQGRQYLLAKEPNGALSVSDAVKQADDGQEVVLVGRIGGEVDPWVEDMAAFTIVDTKLVPCNERPGDTCETPWDYCCDQNDLPTSSAAIKLVDEHGKVVSESARKLLALKELQTVVVRGRAQRGAEGSLVVLADGLFIKR